MIHTIRIRTVREPEPQSEDDRRVLRERDDRAMLDRPHLWTQHPFLPLKRHVEGQSFPEIGVLLDHPEYRHCVFFLNLFEAKQIRTVDDLAQYKCIHYRSFDELYRSGWIVD